MLFPRRRLQFPLALIALLAASAAPLAASEIRIHRSETLEDREGGVLENVALDDLGHLFPARRLEELATLEEPFVFAAAAAPGGSWIVGTGSSGRVLRVGGDGEITTLAELDAPQVFAVAAGRRGVFAAGSPSGPVVVLGDGDPEVVFDPEATYVWALELDDRGRLLVATGLPGRVWRIGRDGDAEQLWESPDGHVRSLAIAPDGSVIAGTAGEGRIVRIGPDGAVETLLDAEMPEVVALDAGDDGRIVAALLASEASQVDLSGGGEIDGGGVSVVVQGAETTIGSRAAGFEGPRSRVLEVRPGRPPVELVHFDDETIHSLALSGRDLWIGTGEEGRLWRHDGARTILERDLEAGQIVDLVPGDGELTVVTTDAGTLWRLTDRPEPTGGFTSDVLDLGSTSRFGSWAAEGRDLDGNVSVRLRSGLSASPDGTWTGWTESVAGAEVDLEALGPGRYVQWQAELRGTGDGEPRLGPVELTALPINAAPIVETFAVLAPGEILVSSSFNPQNQVYEPWSPNRQGIFETLRAEGADGSNGTKTLWKKGWRTLQWKAEDPDEDELRYRLSFRPEAGGGSGASWQPMAEDLDQTWYSFDATALPQGAYRFRLEASDEAANLPGEGHVVTETSTLATVDHVPPRVVSAERKGGVWSVEVADDLGPIRAAEVSVDGGAWVRVAAEDGLVDERRETLRIETPKESSLVVLRLIDAAHNTTAVEITGE